MTNLGCANTTIVLAVYKEWHFSQHTDYQKSATYSIIQKLVTINNVTYVYNKILLFITFKKFQLNIIFKQNC